MDTTQLIKKCFDISKNILIAIDNQGKVILINKEGCKILGYKNPEEVIGKDWFENFLPKSTRKETRDYAKKIMAGLIKPGDYHENYIITKNNKKKLIAWNSSIIKNNAGESLGHFSSGYDITEKREYESKLKKTMEEAKESKEMLQKIIDLLPVRIFWKDKNLNYLGCNLAFANDAGKKSPMDIIGKNDFMMGWKNQAEIYRRDDKKVITSGIPKRNYSEPQTTVSGKIIWLLTNKVPLKDNMGKISGVIGTYLNITNEKEAEKKLIEKTQELEQFNKLAVGRELKMIELKKEINSLLSLLNKKPKYDLD